MKVKIVTFLIILSFFFLIGCAERIEKRCIETNISLLKTYSGEVPPLFDDLDQESLEMAIERSMQYYDRLPDERVYCVGSEKYSVKDFKESLIVFLKIIRTCGSNSLREKKIREEFDIYKSTGNDGKGSVLFTGYYAPVLRGSLTKTSCYKYPIYQIPDDHLVIGLGKFKSKYNGDRIVARLENGKVVPYYNRTDIDIKKCLSGRGLEIVWLSDPVDLFFLHIQGSGRIILSNGDIMNVSYSNCNGWPYRSIGKLLIEQKKVFKDELSLDSIREYLREHPEEMFDILGHNQSYVFFRIVEDGPLGCLNVPVTSGRSIATDSSVFPKGVLAFIRTRKPVIDEKGKIKSWESFSRFVLNQDTGGAIKGPGRVDLYCGSGKNAETMAGHLKEEGELFFLVKKR